MHRWQRGRVEWAALAALAATVTAMAALVVALLVFWSVRQDNQRARFSSALDSLGHLDAQWDSDSMAAVRSAAATALLNERPTRDVDDVLDFFDHVAWLVDREALDEEMVWYDFYRPLAGYWFASQDHVHQVQHDDAARWQQLSTLVSHLVATETRRRKHDAATAVPTKSEIRAFLTAESEATECAEGQDSETRKTPL